jgi:hypothetical protein
MKISKQVKRRTPFCGAVVILLLSMVGVGSVAHGQSFVAGVQPNRRPEGAPRIQTMEKSPQWHRSATAGVVRPVPPSLKFLDDQGAWYTPFNRPGMTGRFDIRKLHRN